MVPNFALALLFQGIRLLRRTPEGWALLDEVPLDSPDLAGDLARLRAAGLASGTPWEGTHLLLPPEQVRTLSLEGEQDEEAVLTALEGMTPYAVADLVVDYAASDGRTHVAAVARETLDEAEAFAADHGFHPLSFGAALEEFPREASFGPTRLAATLETPAEADFTAIPPEGLDAANPGDAGSEAVTEGGSTLLSFEAAALEDAASAPPERLPAADFIAEALGEVAPSQDAEPRVAAPGATSTIDVVAPEPATELAAIEEPHASTLAGADLSVAVEPTALPENLPVDAAGSAEASERPSMEASTAAPTASILMEAPAPIFASRATPLKDGTRAAAPVLGAPEGARPPRGRRAEPSLRKSAAPAGAPTPAPLRSEPRATDMALRPEAVASSGDARPTVATSRAEPPEPAGRFGFTQSRASQGRGRPRYLGLVLTVLLLVVMAAVAVLASVSERGLAGLFRPAEVLAAAAPAAEPGVTSDPAPEALASAAPQAPDAATTKAAAAAVAAAMARLAAPAPDTEAPRVLEPAEAAAIELPPSDLSAVPGAAPLRTAEAPSTVEPPPVPANEAFADATGPVSPSEADRVYAATGVWLGAPRLPLLPGAEDAAPQGAAPPALSPAKALAAPPVLAALGPDLGMVRQFDPPAPGDTRPRDDRGLVLATPEGTRAASGILLFAGSPTRVPPARPAPEAAPDATSRLDAVAARPSSLPPARSDASATVATAPEVQGPPVAPEGAQVTKGPTGGWINALAETPGRLPPARPAAPAEFLAAVATPSALTFAEAAPSYAGRRPASRPADLSPPVGGEPAPRILASYDGPRPGARPQALALEAPDVSGALAEAMAAPEVPAAPPAPAAPDLQSTLAAIVQGAPDPLAGATSRAVAAVRLPDARPRSFDRVVQRQLDRVARASQASQRPAAGGLTAQEEAEAGEAEPASSAAAAPTGPTATSVAAAATSADAIRLRDTNLIGVYGQPGARRALVRTGNGRYLRVGIGDALEGGQVTAIGDNALNYVRRGRTEVLVIPGG